MLEVEISPDLAEDLEQAAGAGMWDVDEIVRATLRFYCDLGPDARHVLPLVGRMKDERRRRWLCQVTGVALVDLWDKTV